MEEEQSRQEIPNLHEFIMFSLRKLVLIGFDFLVQIKLLIVIRYLQKNNINNDEMLFEPRIKNTYNLVDLSMLL